MVPEVSAVVEAYRPRLFCPEAAAFAQEVVRAGKPVSAVRARTLLWSAAALAEFGLSVGLEAVPQVLLHPSAIERFITVGLSKAPAARRRSVRTNLRFLSRRVIPQLSPPQPVALPRSRAKDPYTSEEMESFLALARSQPTQARAMRLSALLCLGAGAGLTGADMRHVRGDHVERRHGGVVVAVEGGPSPRVVPVLRRYGEALVKAGAFGGKGYICGGVVPTRRNITNRLVAQVAGGTDLPRLELGRLRATWLATCATALGLPGFLAAAGVTHSQHISDVVAALPVPPEAEIMAALGALP